MAVKPVRLLLGLAIIVMTGPAMASGEAYLIDNVTLIDVESGHYRQAQSLLIEDGLIQDIGPVGALAVPTSTVHVDGTGKYLIPGLWDMHVHSHREQRWTYHYPLFRAFGVVGVRDAGSHLGSALVAMERAQSDPLAPHVIWGSPIIDGAPPYNSFGVSAEDGDAGRRLVREFQRLGFDFIKIYDRLTPEAYRAIADEAELLGIGLEGHVPLALSPLETIDAGQRLIDHLTLILESCTPGMLEMAHAVQRDDPSGSDSLDLLMDDRFAAALPGYDAAACQLLFRSFAEHHVWQVPTLIEMRGYFHADDPNVTGDVRIDMTTPHLLESWKAWGVEADPAQLANGRKVLAAQMAMLRPMQNTGVGIMTGTDASSEPWVFAGSSVHDEMTLLVEAGLTPLEALQAATLNPLLYQGRGGNRLILSTGESADLVLLDADPLTDIDNIRHIVAVFARGQYHDRQALDALIERGRMAAAGGRR